MDGFDYTVNTLNEGDIMLDLGFINNCDLSGDVDYVTRNSEGSTLKPVESMDGKFSLSTFDTPAYDFLCDNDFSRSMRSDVSDQQSGHHMENNTYSNRDNSYLGYPLFTSNVNDTKYSNVCSFDNGGNYNPQSSINYFGMDSNYNYASNQHASISNELFRNTLHQQNDNWVNLENSENKVRNETNCKDTVNALHTVHSLQSNANGEDVTGNGQVHLLESFANAFQKSGNVLRTNTPFKYTDMTNNLCNENFSIDHNRDKKSQIEYGENNSSNMEEYRQNDNSYFLPNNNFSALSADEEPQCLHKKNVFSTSNEAHNMLQSIKTTSHLHLLDLHKNNMQETSLYQQNHSAEPTNFIVLPPLQTRKFPSSCLYRQSNTSKNVKCNSHNLLLNNSTVFDIGSKVLNQNNFAHTLDSNDCNIHIPKAENLNKSILPYGDLTQNKTKKSNRRKQTLKAIPDAEHIFFEIKHEIESSEETEFREKSTDTTTNFEVKIEEDPYPEVELPELDEIFQRKKRSCMNSNLDNKRTLPHFKFKTKSTKKYTSLESAGRQFNIIQETSASFEEKVSISRNISANICNDGLAHNSDSDLSEYDCQVVSIVSKSLKCSHCNKMFKTARSLDIHMKQCNGLNNVAGEHNIKLTHNLIENSKLKMKNENNVMAPLKSGGFDINDNKRKHVTKKWQPECGGSFHKKTKYALKEIGRETLNDRNYIRPMTRSQTRQSVDQIKTCASSKRSKKVK